jgi:hypothetical protein
LKFRVLGELLAVCRLAANADLPDSLQAKELWSVTRTPDELSIVCSAESVPQGVIVERDWIALKLEGPLPFSMTGILASFLQPLAEANIPIFAVSTFDTDYVLIKQNDLERAQAALSVAGHQRVEKELVRVPAS